MTKKSKLKLQEESIINVELTEGVDRYEDVYYELRPKKIIDHIQKKNHFIFTTDNGIQLRIDGISDSIFRFRYTTIDEGFEPDHSYALSDAKFKRPQLKLKEKNKRFIISSTNLNCIVEKKDLKVSIEDKSGNLISEDAYPFYKKSTILQGALEVKINKKIQEGEAFFGLGDKSCDLNLKGNKLENWNTDAFGFSATSDPLYRSIPFYYGLHQGMGYGIFLHNTFKSHFDFGASEAESCSFWTEGGQMDYFFIYGPELLKVAETYHELTGTPELPPLWALGYHQCRWSYYPESRVKELAEEFRSREIPCDAIYLDIDYMDGYRCFTWNKDYFPKPAKMIKQLGKKGFQTVVMIDPGIRADQGYAVYESGLEIDAYCRRTSGELMKGPVWPPECVFPDYTRADVRAWWGELYKELYKKQGISGFWNDMNEPAVFKVNSKTFPDEVMHDFDGHPANHKKGHNIYGLLMSQATYEGLKKLQPEKRPFVLTRATFSGGQRYAAVWTGDNFATWEHLRLANIQCQRLSLSGFSFNGTDIGGFADQPDGELFVRWLQLGVFHPLFRVHSMGNKAGGDAEVDEESVKEAEALNRVDQEPWSFGEPYTCQARTAIELRYQLLPYHYTAFWQNVNQGKPVIKSLSFYDQNDSEAVKREQEFIYGDNLLVCPVLKPKQKSLTVYMPKGEWLDYYTGRIYEGGRKWRLSLKNDHIPLLVKAGSVIPNYPVQQYVGEKSFSSIDLRVYFGQNGSGLLYEDAGEGYEYEKGKYKLSSFQTSYDDDVFTISQEQVGKFKPSYKKLIVKVIGLPFEAANIHVDGKQVDCQLDETGVLEIEVKAKFKQITIS